MERDLALPLLQFGEAYQSLNFHDDGDVEEVEFQKCLGFLVDAMNNLYNCRHGSMSRNSNAFCAHFLMFPSDEGKLDRAGKLATGIATLLSNFGLCQLAIQTLNLPSASQDRFSEELRSLLISVYLNASLLTQTELVVHHQLYQLGVSIEVLRNCCGLQEDLHQSNAAVSLVLLKAVIGQVHLITVSTSRPDATNANDLLQCAASRYLTSDGERARVLLAIQVKQEELGGLAHGPCLAAGMHGSGACAGGASASRDGRVAAASSGITNFFREKTRVSSLGATAMDDTDVGQGMDETA